MMPRSASRSTASSQARASMHAVIWSAMSTSSRTSRAVPASKRVTSIRFSTRSFSRRVSLTTSRTAGSIIGSTLPVSASSSSSRTSVTAVIAVSGVRSSCDMSATKRRDASSRALMSATRFSSASAVRLNVRERSASSSVPDTRSRVSSLPSPSRRAAMPEPVHRLEHRRRGGLRQQRRADQREAGRDPQRPGEGVEILRLRLQRLEHVAGRPAADHLRAAHEIRLVVVGRSAASTGGTRTCCSRRAAAPCSPPSGGTSVRPPA